MERSTYAQDIQDAFNANVRYVQWKHLNVKDRARMVRQIISKMDAQDDAIPYVAYEITKPIVADWVLRRHMEICHKIKQTNEELDKLRSEVTRLLALDLALRTPESDESDE
jgi:acyl-CoA reductase-like NAD-dependent aldehyde dehydrogenase